MDASLTPKSPHWSSFCCWQRRGLHPLDPSRLLRSLTFCAKFVLLYLYLKKKNKLVLGIQISCWSYVQFGMRIIQWELDFHPMRIISLKAVPVSLHSFRGILHVPLRSSVSKLHFSYIHFPLYLKQNTNWRARLFWYKQEAAGLCREITSTPRSQLLQALNSTLINLLLWW